MRKLLSLSNGGRFRKTLLKIIALTIITAIAVFSPVNVLASFDDGYEGQNYYFVWTNDLGQVNFQSTGYDSYSVTWNSKGASGFNFTCGKGWRSGERYRKIYYEGNFNPGNNGYLALYGWSEQPTGSQYAVVEYYVVESYGNWTPPGNNAVSLGTVQSDGATYNLYRSFRQNSPSIRGINEDFYQYWSIRVPKKSTGNISGTITFNNHVKAWENAGLTIGDLSVYYQVMETEGYESSGSSSIRMTGVVDDYEVNPYVRPISIVTGWSDGYRVMYIDNDNKMKPSSIVDVMDEEAMFEMEYLYMDHIDYHHYTEWAPVVALKSKRTGKYVTVSNSTSNVKADGNSISTAQKFHFFDFRGDCGFVSVYNNKSLNFSGICNGDRGFSHGFFDLYWHWPY